MKIKTILHAILFVTLFSLAGWQRAEAATTLTCYATCDNIYTNVVGVYTLDLQCNVTSPISYNGRLTVNGATTGWVAKSCPQSPPTVTTPTVSSITTTGATLGANVTSLGVPASITARGTCWGTSPAPSTKCLAEGGTTTGIFTHARTGMTAGTTYYYRGYAINSTGTGYSADGTFTTSAPTCADNTVPPLCTTCPANNVYFSGSCVPCVGGCTGSTPGGPSPSSANGNQTCNNGAPLPPLCVNTCSNGATNWSTCDLCPGGQVLNALNRCVPAPVAPAVIKPKYKQF